jgi:hypothetical protein
MPGSQTTPGPTGARNNAPADFAFRQVNNVGTRIDNDFVAQWLAYTLPYRRFADVLADACARIGATWIATPSPQWTFTTYSLPVSRRTHSRYGPSDCSAAQGGICRKASARPPTPPSRLPATRSNQLLSGWNPPPLVIRAVGAH